MMTRQLQSWRMRIVLMVLSAWMAAGVWAQNPPYRPNLMWHIAAGYTNFPTSFTEDGEYLLAQGLGNYTLVMVYQTSALLNPSTPLGHALVSYDYSNLQTTFTDKDEAGKEYVVGFSGNVVRMWRWVRDPLAFRGGYLEAPKQWTISGWNTWFTQRVYPFPVAMVLRGDRTDRRYNRLAVSGDGNGNLRIVLLDYNATSQTPVVVSGAHGGAITALTYDPQTRRLITGGRDGLIRIWQVALDAGGTPSLTPLQTIAAHWSDVVSLALAQVGSARYLVSLSLNHELAGWSWPNPSPTPLWYRTVEWGGPLEETEVIDFLSGGTPYGDLNWVILETARPFQADPGGLRGTVLLIDPATGKEHYRYVGVGLGYNRFYRTFIVSPPISGVRYLVGIISPNWLGLGNVVAAGSGGIWRASLDRTQTLATAPASVTAMDSLSAGGVRYLAVGYANGELRVYRNTGSSWSLWDSAATLHSGKQVVGVRLIAQSGGLFTLSADVEGTLAVAQHTGSVTPKLSFSTGLTAAEALALGADATSALVAVAGQKDGAPRVEVLRLTWSGTTPSLTNLAGFDVAGELGPAVDVEFVQVGSADVVVSTGTRPSRWNFASNAYSRALNFGGTSPIQYASISVAGNRLWQAAPLAPRVEDIGTGALLWSQAGDNYSASAFPILALSADQAVWGIAYRSTSQDNSYWVARGRGLTRPQTVSNVTGEGLQAALPEAPVAIARDPSNPDLFYVGCLDGSIQQVLLPDFAPSALMGYAGLSGTLFEIVQNRIATFLTGYGPAFRWFGDSGVGIRHAAIVRLTDGQPASTAIQCNADGTSGCNPYDVGINALMRLSPSGNVLYGYEVGNNRLTGWNGTTMAPLFNTTSFPTHWWPIGVDDTRVALLYNEARGSYQIGTTTYYRYRPVIRIIKWTPTLTTEATRPLDENTEMGFIMQNPNVHPNYLQGMRWDMNSTRRVAAVWGAHYYDPNSPTAYERRILILHRPNPNDWGTWVVREVLRQGVDFPGLVYPTMIRFHPNAPGVLYVGLSNGRLRIYRLDANGNLLNRTNPDELVPTLGTLGPVSAMDVGNYVLNGLNYSAIVFGGPEGLSVWVGFVCQPGWLNEVHFYKTDIAFFPSAGMGYVQVEQPDPSQPPFLVYSNGLVMSAARLDNLPELPCPEDVNRDGVVDDADILEVLFAFGGEGYIPADVNCDGIVDDADLLQVLFVFGQQC